LTTIAVRKSVASFRFEQAQRRGGGQQVFSFEDVNQRSSSMTEQRRPVTLGAVEELIQSIKDPKLARVARMKVEGLETSDIARELNCSMRLVQYIVKDLENLILGRNTLLAAS